MAAQGYGHNSPPLFWKVAKLDSSFRSILTDLWVYHGVCCLPQSQDHSSCRMRQLSPPSSSYPPFWVEKSSNRGEFRQTWQHPDLVSAQCPSDSHNVLKIYWYWSSQGGSQTALLGDKCTPERPNLTAGYFFWDFFFSFPKELCILIYSREKICFKIQLNPGYGCSSSYI